MALQHYYPILELPLKRGSAVDFVAPLTNFVTTVYQEPSDQYTSDFIALTQLRQAALSATTEEIGRAALRAYYSQLDAVQPRFEQGDKKIDIYFSWTDTLTEKNPAVQENSLNFERANLLYNMAAVELGISSFRMRQADKDIRSVCSSLQAAAGMCTAAADMKMSKPVDLTPDALGAIRNYSLAEAQLCLVQKAINDNKGHELIAGLLMKAAEYYDEALACVSRLPADPSAASVRGWLVPLQLRALHARAAAHDRMSDAAAKGQRFGDQVAYLKAASQLLADAVKAAGKAHSAEASKNLKSAVDARLAKADRENDVVYHEKVLPAEQLPPIEALSVATATRVPAGEASLLKALVPLAVRMTASQHSEEAMNIYRRVSSLADDKDAELHRALAQMGLPLPTATLKLNFDPPEFQFPATLLQRAAVLRDGMQFLDVFENVNKLYVDGSKLRESIEAYEKEAAPSGRYASEAQRLKALCETSSAVDAELSRVCDALRPRLMLLCGPFDNLRAALPTLNVMDLGDDTEAIARITSLFDKVKQMAELRSSCLRDLKERVLHVDITDKLLAGNSEEALAAILKDHNAAAKRVEENFEIQDKLLPAVIDAHAALARRREVLGDLEAKQKKFVDELSMGADQVEEIRSKLKEGQRVHQQLREQIDELVAATPKAMRPTEPASGGAYSQLLNDLDSTDTDGMPEPGEHIIVHRKSIDDDALQRQISAFEQRMQTLARVNQNNTSGYEQEFALLRMSDLGNTSSCNAALTYRHLNRYGDILPFDHARVSVPRPSQSHDYINASHVNINIKDCPPFICSQGPTLATRGDFWAMVLQRNVDIVVMVTNVTEAGRPKCEQYWPRSIGDIMALPFDSTRIDVKLVSERVSPLWVERKMELSMGGMQRIITQLHYIAWPDKGVPRSPGDLYDFISATERIYATCIKTPILVHCSAGVGRTGTFCLAYAAMRAIMAGASGWEAVPDMVLQMRQSRRYMVQTIEQYRFCYEVVLYTANEALRHHTTRRKTKASRRQSDSCLDQYSNSSTEPALSSIAEGDASLLDGPLEVMSMSPTKPFAHELHTTLPLQARRAPPPIPTLDQAAPQPLMPSSPPPALPPKSMALPPLETLQAESVPAPLDRPVSLNADPHAVAAGVLRSASLPVDTPVLSAAPSMYSQVAPSLYSQPNIKSTLPQRRPPPPPVESQPPQTPPMASPVAQQPIAPLPFAPQQEQYAPPQPAYFPSQPAFEVGSEPAVHPPYSAATRITPQVSQSYAPAPSEAPGTAPAPAPPTSLSVPSAVLSSPAPLPPMPAPVVSYSSQPPHAPYPQYSGAVAQPVQPVVDVYAATYSQPTPPPLIPAAPHHNQPAPSANSDYYPLTFPPPAPHVQHSAQPLPPLPPTSSYSTEPTFQAPYQAPHQAPQQPPLQPGLSSTQLQPSALYTSQASFTPERHEQYPPFSNTLPFSHNPTLSPMAYDPNSYPAVVSQAPSMMPPQEVYSHPVQPAPHSLNPSATSQYSAYPPASQYQPQLQPQPQQGYYPPEAAFHYAPSSQAAPLYAAPHAAPVASYPQQPPQQPAHYGPPPGSEYNPQLQPAFSAASCYAPSGYAPASPASYGAPPPQGYAQPDYGYAPPALTPAYGLVPHATPDPAAYGVQQPHVSLVPVAAPTVWCCHPRSLMSQAHNLLDSYNNPAIAQPLVPSVVHKSLLD